LLQGKLDSAGPLIAEVAQEIANAEGRERDLKVSVENAAVDFSQTTLRKIVQELIENAFRYSAPGTPVKVDGRVEGGRFHLKISDKGLGMNPEQIEQSGAFTQFDRKFREQQGAGLGLAISKKLVELSGGQFRIESTPGKGTTIHILR
jgi:two-component system, sensor histidine kinase and response regulator